MYRDLFPRVDVFLRVDRLPRDGVKDSRTGSIVASSLSSLSSLWAVKGRRRSPVAGRRRSGGRRSTAARASDYTPRCQDAKTCREYLYSCFEGWTSQVFASVGSAQDQVDKIINRPVGRKAWTRSCCNLYTFPKLFLQAWTAK